jgi:hypothetical protein
MPAAGMTHAAADTAGPRRYSVAYFQYLGRTALTVAGPVSGKLYRFDGPGVTVAVDLRDRTSLAAVPHLQQVVGPAAI